MKALIKITLAISFSFGLLYANGNSGGQTNGTTSATTQAELAKIFVNPNASDAIDTTSSCEWTCRAVNSNYATQISGFDFENGITYCRVYQKDNLDEPLVYNANKQRESCKNQNTQGHSLTSSIKNNLNQKAQVGSKIEYIPNDNEITLSQFLSSLVTLNPNIIDREATKNLGQLELKDNKSLKFTEVVRDFSVAQDIGNPLNLGRFIDFITPNDLKTHIYNRTSAVDGFNKNNMAYFSDLFVNMEKVYQHLQMLLFIVVGGFYLSSIGANKLQVYLENRGESASNQPYLHKFYIPLIMVGTFFMPIPEANGLAHSTICQNIIRYFTTESTKIADMASAIGGKTYMDKIYKSVGGINEVGINDLNKKYSINQNKINQGELIYKNTCSRRYEDITTSKGINYLLAMSDEEKKEYMHKIKFDREQIAGKEYDITLEACIFLEQEINKAILDNKKLDTMFQGINDFYANNVAAKRLKDLDGYFAIRENQLGWLNSLLTPSSAILAEIMTFNKYAIVEANMESATKQNQINNKEAQKKGDVDVRAWENEVDDGVIAWLSGRLVWLMLPGAEQVKKFVENAYSSISAILTTAISFSSSGLGVLSGIILKMAETLGVYYLTSLIIEVTFQKVPLLVCTTASVIAFVSYLVSLCKYFYISPFVVAFSMATKRMNKIVDFLVSGISIFFKPILIVLFIYLALFVHTLINEIFVFFSVEQFSGVVGGLFDPLGIFVANAICGLLKIFGVLASSYIMWKLIVSGPGWALSLVGIDGKHDDMISQGIEQHLARRAFVA